MEHGRVLDPSGQALSAGETLLSFPTLLLDGYFQLAAAGEDAGGTDGSDGEGAAAAARGKAPTAPSVVEARLAYEQEVPLLKRQWVGVLQQWRAYAAPPSQAGPLAARGVPPAMRAAVWLRAIGNASQVTASLYKLSLARALELRAAADAAKPPPRRRDEEEPPAPPSEARSEPRSKGRRARARAAARTNDGATADGDGVAGAASALQSPDGVSSGVAGSPSGSSEVLGITPRKLHDPLTDTITSPPPGARSRVSTAADEVYMSTVRSRLDLAGIDVSECGTQQLAGGGLTQTSAAECRACSTARVEPLATADPAVQDSVLSLSSLIVELGGSSGAGCAHAAPSSPQPTDSTLAALVIDSTAIHARTTSPVVTAAAPVDDALPPFMRVAPPSPLALRVAGCGSLNADPRAKAATTLTLLPSPAAAALTSASSAGGSKGAAGAVATPSGKTPAAAAASSASRASASHSSRARRYGVSAGSSTAAAAGADAAPRRRHSRSAGPRERSKTGDSWYASEAAGDSDEAGTGYEDEEAARSQNEEAQDGNGALTDGCHEDGASRRRSRRATSASRRSGRGELLLGDAASPTGAHAISDGGLLYACKTVLAAPSDGRQPEAEAPLPQPRVKVPLDTGEAAAATGAVLAAGPLIMLAPVSRHVRRRVWRVRWAALLPGCLALYKATSRDAFRALLRGDDSTPVRLDGPAAAAGRTGGIYLAGAELGRVMVPADAEADVAALASSLPSPVVVSAGSYYAFEVVLPERSQSCLFRVHSADELLTWVGVLLCDTGLAPQRGNGDEAQAPVAPPLARFFAHGEPLVLRQLRPAPRPSQAPTPELIGLPGPADPTDTSGSALAAAAPAAAPQRVAGTPSASPPLSSTAVVMQRLDSFLQPHAVLSRGTSRSASFSMSPSLVGREPSLLLPASRGGSRSASFSLLPAPALGSPSVGGTTARSAGLLSGSTRSAEERGDAIAAAAEAAVAGTGLTAPAPVTAAPVLTIDTTAAVVPPQGAGAPSSSGSPSPVRARRPRPAGASPLLGGQASPLLTAALAPPPAMSALQALGPTFSGEATHLSEVDVDLSRTFPEFAFFEQGSDFRTQLQNVLMAYAVHRPDQGYLQGMSHIAAILLLTVGSVNASTDSSSSSGAGGQAGPAGSREGRPQRSGSRPASRAPAASRSPTPRRAASPAQAAAQPTQVRQDAVATPERASVAAGSAAAQESPPAAPATPARSGAPPDASDVMATPAGKPPLQVGGAATSRGLGTPSARTPSTTQPARRTRRRGGSDTDVEASSPGAAAPAVEGSSPSLSTPATKAEARLSASSSAGITSTPAPEPKPEDATAPLFDEDGVYVPMSARKAAAAAASGEAPDASSATSLTNRRPKRFGPLTHALHSLTHLSTWRGKGGGAGGSRKETRSGEDSGSRSALSTSSSHRLTGQLSSATSSASDAFGLDSGASGDLEGGDSPGFGAHLAGSSHWLPPQSSEVLVFTCLCNLLMRPPLRWAATRNMTKLSAWYSLYSSVLARVAPRVAAHLSGLGLDPSFYLMSWVITLFSNPLGLEVAIRLWDRVLLGGSEEVLKCAVGLTKHLGPALLAGGPTAFEASFHTLSKVPAPLRDEFAIAAAASAIKLTAAEVAALNAMEADLIE